MEESDRELETLQSIRSELQVNVQGVDHDNAKLRDLLRQETEAHQQAVRSRKEMEKKLKKALEEAKMYRVII